MYINQVVDFMFLTPTNETEIINIVKSLSGNKSHGHDEVPPSDLKSIFLSCAIKSVKILVFSDVLKIKCSYIVEKL